jgi:hypothetical protein
MEQRSTQLLRKVCCAGCHSIKKGLQGAGSDVSPRGLLAGQGGFAISAASMPISSMLLLLPRFLAAAVL